ncbi:MAG: biopolymer transporter ExbD [Proteobacteria bacterium]|jgi:biopolymer transport protein ExbD|nr:biopolymer transporter ExbD [Pseudomonadota bacterium]MCC6631890.1 biopolymer transporter ExbD [Gammaproteobacteria bacterium]
MSMSVPGSDGDDKVMSDINTTPLVDVMLVMLIIFLITIPVIVPTVKVDLPDPRNIATQTKPEDIPVSIDRDGNVYWRGGRVEDRAKLLELMVEQARLDPQPELHLKADRNARYENVARVLFVIQQSGLQKVSFLTEPKAAIN